MSRLRGIATGERLGRWQVISPAPDAGELLRVRVADEAGHPAEALVLGREADGPTRARFAERHRQLLQLDPPGLVHTLDVLEEAERVVVVREATEDPTLADAEVPIGGAQVAAIGVHLFQAVQEAGSVLGGGLLPYEVGLDAHGRPLLAPSGQSPTTVPRPWLGHVAPESFGDAPPGPSSGLYGLGALLYRLATGTSPAGGASPQRPPPVPPSHLRHGLHPSLDRAITLLLSTDPVERSAALPLLQEVAGDLEDLRPRSTRSLVGEVQYTTQTTAREVARPDDDPGGFVVLPPSEWSRLTAAQRSHAAGRADIALSTADGLARQGLPIVLDTAVGRAGARRGAETLRTEQGLPVHAVTGGGVPAAIPLVTGLGIAALPAVLGVLVTAVGWWWLGVPLVLLGGLVAVMAVVMAGAVGRGRSQRNEALEAHRQQAHHRRERGGRGRLDPAWQRAARLRRQLAEQDHLPEAAEAIDRAERRLGRPLDARIPFSSAAVYGESVWRVGDRDAPPALMPEYERIAKLLDHGLWSHRQEEADPSHPDTATRVFELQGFATAPPQDPRVRVDLVATKEELLGTSRVGVVRVPGTGRGQAGLVTETAKQLRKGGLDSAVIVTESAPTKVLTNTAAREPKISVVGEPQLLDRLIDWRSYLHWLADETAGSAWEDHIGRLTLRGWPDPPPGGEPADRWLGDDWMNDDVPLAVLVGPETGRRSTLSRWFAHDLAQEALRRPYATNGRIPVLLPLGRYRRELDVDTLFADLLADRRHFGQRGQPVDPVRALHLLHELGRIVFVVEELDTLPEPDQAMHAIAELAGPRAKILVNRYISGPGVIDRAGLPRHHVVTFSHPAKG
mgnify:CR=1 FL=1